MSIQGFLFNMTLIKNLSTLFTSPLNSAALQQPVAINNSEKAAVFRFGEITPYNDSFSSNSLYVNFKGKSEIETMAKSNPRIMQLLKENNIPLKVNIEELEALRNGHLQSTRILAAKIASNMKQQL